MEAEAENERLREENDRWAKAVTEHDGEVTRLREVIANGLVEKMKMQAQRDTLLAALRPFAAVQNACCQGTMGYDVEGGCVHERARAAISEVGNPVTPTAERDELLTAKYQGISTASNSEVEGEKG